MVSTWIVVVAVTFAPVYDKPMQQTEYKIAASDKEQCYVEANWINNNYENFIKPTWPGMMKARCTEKI